MISKTAKSYCCEDLSLIENYELAIADTTQTWDCHHRVEVLDGRKMFSRDELKHLNLYFDRPAKELIFLTKSEHSKIHGADRAKAGKIAIQKMTKEQRSKGGKIGGKISGKIAMQKMTFEQRSKGGKIAMQKRTFEQQSKVGKLGGKKNAESGWIASLGKKSAKPILQYTKAGEFVKEWESAREVQRQLGINHSHISQCCNGRRKYAGGFVWRFKKSIQHLNATNDISTIVNVN